ncbi:16681_t:CDS:1, partial [Racocetra persica]
KNVENCNDIQVAENLNVVAIDPGVRTGWSWYSPSKGCGWFGNLDINRVFRLRLIADHNPVRDASKFSSSVNYVT